MPNRAESFHNGATKTYTAKVRVLRQALPGLSYGLGFAAVDAVSVVAAAVVTVVLFAAAVVAVVSVFDIAAAVVDVAAATVVVGVSRIAWLLLY